MQKVPRLAGVDEAGRGPLAGPVSAAAVILSDENPIVGLKDSKLLSAKQRMRLCAKIKDKALAWSIAWADVEEIDRLNILQASLLAMQRAVADLAVKPQLVLVDGNVLPRLSCPAQAIVKGDSKVAAISAASIIAKVERDAFMQSLDADYPGYGFAKHKGYPTQQHLLALQQLGVSKVHRRSFRPVQAVLKG